MARRTLAVDARPFQGSGSQINFRFGGNTRPCCARWGADLANVRNGSISDVGFLPASEPRIVDFMGTRLGPDQASGPRCGKAPLFNPARFAGLIMPPSIRTPEGDFIRLIRFRPRLFRRRSLKSGGDFGRFRLCFQSGF